jgi:hypothetical protein
MRENALAVFGVHWEIAVKDLVSIVSHEVLDVKSKMGQNDVL